MLANAGFMQMSVDYLIVNLLYVGAIIEKILIKKSSTLAELRNKTYSTNRSTVLRLLRLAHYGSKGSCLDDIPYRL